MCNMSRWGMKGNAMASEIGRKVGRRARRTQSNEEASLRCQVKEQVHNVLDFFLNKQLPSSPFG